MLRGRAQSYQLSQFTEPQLRELGWGYRAPRLVAAVRKLVTLGGDDWLSRLAPMPLHEVRVALQQLAGVGPKVADCICLFSTLQQHAAIPVDTHCWYDVMRLPLHTILLRASAVPEALH